MRIPNPTSVAFGWLLYKPLLRANVYDRLCRALGCTQSPSRFSFAVTICLIKLFITVRLANGAAMKTIHLKKRTINLHHHIYFVLKYFNGDLHLSYASNIFQKH